MDRSALRRSSKATIQHPGAGTVVSVFAAQNRQPVQPWWTRGADETRVEQSARTTSTSTGTLARVQYEYDCATSTTSSTVVVLRSTSEYLKVLRVVLKYSYY